MSKFSDATAVECFRRGAPLVGPIPASPDTTSHVYSQGADVQQLKKKCRKQNEILPKTLKEDPHSDYLEKQAKEDAGSRRMTPLTPVSDLNLDEVLLGRRFSREQGRRQEGSTKIRAVDDESANGVKECAVQQGKVRMDSIDHLVMAILLFKQLTGVAPGLWKADIDAAYRRIPLLPEHMWMSWITFLLMAHRWLRVT